MPKKKNSTTDPNSFERTVASTPDVALCYRPGLKALGANSNKVLLHDTRVCQGSVDIDSCTAQKYPSDNRWDFVFAYRDKAYFVEVHPAETEAVSTVLKKLSWLKNWLNSSAPELKNMQADMPYYWVQSGRFNIPATTRQHRQIIQAGLKPISRLELP